MKHLSALLLTLLLTLILPSALADEQLCFIRLDDQPEEVITQCSYISVLCSLTDSVPVSIDIYDACENLVYQRNYGSCVGPFHSEEVYLRLSGGETHYLLRANLGDETREVSIVRKLPRLENNIATTCGYPLTKLSGNESRMSITLIDANALAEQPLSVPVQCAGQYDIGYVTFRMTDGYLSASLMLHAGLNAVINDDVIYVATTSVGAMNLDSGRFTGIQGALDTFIDLQGAPYAAVLVKITVSFDPSSALQNPTVEMEGQHDLWLNLLYQTESNAVG